LLQHTPSRLPHPLLHLGDESSGEQTVATVVALRRKRHLFNLDLKFIGLTQQFGWEFLLELVKLG
jgi:hypothetical protein